MLKLLVRFYDEEDEVICIFMLQEYENYHECVQGLPVLILL